MIMIHKKLKNMGISIWASGDSEIKFIVDYQVFYYCNFLNFSI